MEFRSTAEIPVPKDPLQQIIGQDEAVKITQIAARQKRNLLLVGPPGTGKSLLAQALATHLPKPTEEISVLHNPENPDRPFIEVKTATQVAKEKQLAQQVKGRIASPEEVPVFVAERLGFRCRKCSRLSPAGETACPGCGLNKYAASGNASIFSEYLGEQQSQNRVHTTRLMDDGREEVIVYERKGEKIQVLDQKTLEKMDELKKKKPRKVIVPFNRKTFIIATGASETELLGDVRHDPYGGHAQIGTQPYLRVVAGAIHEAHEGVLFIDELSALQYVQRFLLTAMQEKRFAISGKNAQSAGASVRVDDVPCDFIFVAASNINDLQYILPPLRSRIIGNGYEVLLDTTMPDNPENRETLAQFVAQEIAKDGKIPHASFEAVQSLAEESKKRAKAIDDVDESLTLRLRELSGVIRLAGDFAVTEGAELIGAEHVGRALKRGRNAEQQLAEKYGSLWKAGATEYSTHQQKRTAKDSREVN